MDNFRRHGTGKTFAAKDVDGTTYPQTELVSVEEGTAQGVSSTRPLPVELATERDVLGTILWEMKRMNAHLALLNGTEILDEDLE